MSITTYRLEKGGGRGFFLARKRQLPSVPLLKGDVIYLSGNYILCVAEVRGSIKLADRFTTPASIEGDKSAIEQAFLQERIGGLARCRLTREKFASPASAMSRAAVQSERLGAIFPGVLGR